MAKASSASSTNGTKGRASVLVPKISPDWDDQQKWVEYQMSINIKWKGWKPACRNFLTDDLFNFSFGWINVQADRGYQKDFK